MASLSIRSLTDALSDSLRGRILAGDLLPGHRVTEAGLAAHYEVARPTAKAAIERLSAEGLLERDAHRSARVPVLDAERVRDMYFARRLIECQAYRLLAEHKEVPELATRANEQLRDAAGHGRLADVVDSDITFHRALIDGLDSERVTKTHGVLINEMRLCLIQVQAHRLLDPLIIANEHASILDAIAAGDAERAAQQGKAHLDNAEARLTGYLGAHASRQEH